MPDFTQYTCPVCGREITPSDDIVVCPQCGAPHHRDCWKRKAIVISSRIMGPFAMEAAAGEGG